MYDFFSGPLVYQLAQLVEPGMSTPEEAALVFSGPQFFIALLSGLVLAFGFQLLLTNFSLATGISYVGHSSSSDSSDKSASGPSVKGISLAVGFWTLITVSLALFAACWLAVKLSLYSSALLGAITGLVIWGTYFSLLFWVSSTTVGSLIGSVVRTATASFNSLVSTATAAFGAKAASNQIFETAESVAAAVRKEVSAGLENSDVVGALKDYVTTLSSPQLSTESLEQEFERLIQSSNLGTMAETEELNQLDRATFQELVSSRTDLSRQEAERLADRLYRIWQREIGKASGQQPLSELVNYVQTARPGERIAEKVGDRLDQFLTEYRRQGQNQGSRMSSRVLSQSLNTLMGAVMGSVSLSDLEVEDIATKIKQAKDAAAAQGSSLINQLSDSSEPYSIVRADVENYLLSTYPWQLQADRLKAQFREVIYDVDASTSLLRSELSQLRRSDFEAVLSERGLLTPEEIDQTASVLEGVRVQVLKEVVDLDRFQQAKTLQSQLAVFLRQTPKPELLSEMGERAYIALIEDSSASFDDLQVRYAELTPDFFSYHLNARNDLDGAEIQGLTSRLTQLKDEKLSDAHSVQDQAKVKLQSQWQQLQDYLRSAQRSELDPDGIRRDVMILLNEPHAGIHRLRQRLAQFDRESLIQLLSQRDDLSEMEVRRVVRDVEKSWYDTVNMPSKLTAQAQAGYDEATRLIADYLRRTGKPELNPDGIQRDLRLLVNDPKAGTEAVKARLATMDRDTLVQLLSQRDDLSEAEVNEVIDSILATIRSLLKAPRRLAHRAKQEVITFEQSLEDYLRNTKKAELHPEGIKRDLRLLLEDPKLGGQRLNQRLSQIDRDTVVALLAQRPDMTRQEAEQAVEQVLSVRDQMVAQVRQVKEQIQALINRILAKVRAYLNSLDRPELNYDGIRRDVSLMFDDPQTGFEALKLRLSQCDRNTLVAIASSHNAISETDANRVVDQIEAARDGALQKAEQLEREVENRMRALKQEAQNQVEETRKAAEAAAWWIFLTASVSAIASAIAGSLAVAG